MNRQLFQPKASRRRRPIFIVLCVSLLFFWRSSITQSLYQIYDHLGWQYLFAKDRLQISLRAPDHEAQRSLKEKVELLAIENDWMRHALNQRPSLIWHSPRIQRARIIEVVWRQQEAWLRVNVACAGCVAFNGHGLIGRIEPEYGDDLIRPITHHGILLAGKSLKDHNTYLIQGEGEHRSMSILDSDLSDTQAPHDQDLLVTAGLDRFYPPNLLIGQFQKMGQGYKILPAYQRHLGPELYLMHFDHA